MSFALNLSPEGLQADPAKVEAIQQHEFVGRPWSKVATDLCDLDYFSNYIKVAHVQSVTPWSIIKELKAVFARFGIHDLLVTYNGPQFASAEFAVFAQTSSPKYPQSNGKAKNAAKTVKSIFKKCKESGRSEFLALPDWHNKPSSTTYGTSL